MKPKRLHDMGMQRNPPMRLRLSSINKQKATKTSKASSCQGKTKSPNVSTNQKGNAHICSGCNKPIRKDKYLLKACEKFWHENCLRCDRCHTRLGELGSTLYHKSDMNLCRQDYLEMFGETGVCSLCEKTICASEMVMRAKQNTYHLECFACQLCNQRFCVGDRFYLCENKVVCQYDYEEHILPIQRSMFQQTIVQDEIGKTDSSYLHESIEDTSRAHEMTPTQEVESAMVDEESTECLVERLGDGAEEKVNEPDESPPDENPKIEKDPSSDGLAKSSLEGKTMNI